jgi:CHAT domain-containing protein
VNDWRRRILRKEPVTQNSSDPAQTLRRLLWTPVEKHLDGATTVLLSPDGVVSRIPFAALPGKSVGHYLLEDVNLAIVPFARRLPRMIERPPISADDPSLLIVGNVDYGASAGKVEVVAALAPTNRSGEPGSRFTPLAQTKAEIDAVRGTFAKRFPAGKTTVLEKGAATEAAIRLQAGGHRYLHFATHGFFAPSSILSAAAPVEPKMHDLFGKSDVRGFHPGLLSGIALAGANRTPAAGEDDGILTATEVEALDLRKTDLVVLSACETGLGTVAGGEGILGLQRAFQLSGAGSVVASLWSVDDAATRALMDRFYDNLWQKNMPRAEALRQAQIYMLREGAKNAELRGLPRGLVPDDDGPSARSTEMPPFYWAAFVLSGDWR